LSVLPVGFGSAVASGYQIERSLRFNSPDVTYLNRTPASATNQKTWTWSAWIKRSVFGATKVLFDARGAGSNPVHAFYFNSSDQLAVFIRNASGTGIGNYNTSAVFRDPSAWYHITYKFDSTQATATNRVQIYVNGVLQTITASTTISQNADAFINSAISHGIGAEGVTPTDDFDGYMTEVNFVDSPVLVGSTTNASTTITLTTGTTTNIGIGWNVGGTNIPSGATVSSITNSTQFVISSAATATGSSISIGAAPPVSAFGETDSSTGVWKPKKYDGTYGTNGFYLKFADNSGTTSTTLGKDSSGNGNNWTPNNFSVTAGTGNDSLVDSPTSYGTDTGVGGEVRGNYCTLNPLDNPNTAYAVSQNGNLYANLGTGAGTFLSGTMHVLGNKYYWECTPTSIGNGLALGITYGSTTTTDANSKAIFYSFTGGKRIFGTDSSYGASYAANDVIGVAVDGIAGTIEFFKNGTSQGVITNSTITLQQFRPFVFNNSSSAGSLTFCNFGQRPFQKWNGSAYVANTAPSGFQALCTQNLPTPTIGATSTTQANDYMNVVLYTGNGTTTGNTQAITGVGFQPDFVWLKSRSAGTQWHLLNDAIRGTNKLLYSNDSAAEASVTNVFNSFNADGFTVAYNSAYTSAQSNANGSTYVAWNWKANGAGSTNSNGTAKSSAVTVDSGTDTVTWNSHGMSDGQKIGFFAATMPGGLSAGTLYYVRDAATNTFKVAASSGGAAIDITSNGTTVTCHTTLTSTVSANTTSEFSIITYTGSGSNATIEHGLDIAPTLVIVKERPNADSWVIWQSSISAANYLVLNSTAGSTAGSTIWNSTAPTSKVFSVGTNTAINQSSQTYVAYCFAPVAGYSDFGSYTGNNSATDGTFVYLGFRPKFLMIKSTSASTSWVMMDSARNTYNLADTSLYAESANSETTIGTVNDIDFLSNGFKLRNNTGFVNASQTYIYAAFAETPFKYSLAR